MAPDSNMLTRLPSGPSGSTIAGILLFGLSLRKSGDICSPLAMLTGKTLYGRPISSSATEILRPLGVFQVCSSIVIVVIFPHERPDTDSAEADRHPINLSAGRIGATAVD